MEAWNHTLTGRMTARPDKARNRTAKSRVYPDKVHSYHTKSYDLLAYSGHNYPSESVDYTLRKLTFINQINWWYTDNDHTWSKSTIIWQLNSITQALLKREAFLDTQLPEWRSLQVRTTPWWAITLTNNEITPPPPATPQSQWENILYDYPALRIPNCSAENFSSHGSTVQPICICIYIHF